MIKENESSRRITGGNGTVFGFTPDTIMTSMFKDLKEADDFFSSEEMKLRV
jgi:hypothetical protein